MSKEKDILLIRKYLNGELNAPAMHELERRALDDPFLADALEGFEHANSDQQANINDLSSRLQQRIDKKERRIIPWGPLSIAASILVVLGAGIWFFSGGQPELSKRVAQEVKVEPKEKDELSKSPSAPLANTETGKKSATVRAKRPEAKTYIKKSSGDNVQQYAAAEQSNAPVNSEPVANADIQIAEEFYKPKKDSVAASELIVSDQKKAQPGTFKEVPIAKAKQPASPEILLKSKADGVTVTTDASVGGRITHMKTLNGVVIGTDNGQPITGATVKVVGRSFGVVTDVNGKFSLQDVAQDQTLAVNYVGYSPKKVKVSNKDSINIGLQPASSALSEVVIVQNKDNDAQLVPQDAHPKDGWSAFNDYLKKNATSPDGKTGKVKVSFTVAADGSLSLFKITRSVSDAADKKAIDLITKGPAWVGGTDKKAKEVKLSVNFK